MILNLNEKKKVMQNLIFNIQQISWYKLGIN